MKIKRTDQKTYRNSLSQSGRGSARVCVFILAIGLLPGCSSIQKKLSFVPGISNPDTTKIRSIEISADQLANQNSAVEMDILFIMDKNLTASLPVTAADWFDDRTRYLNNNQQDILAANVELPPGGSHKLKMPKGYKKAEDVIAYANYLYSNGQRWLRLTNARHIAVDLEALHWQSSKATKKK